MSEARVFMVKAMLRERLGVAGRKGKLSLVGAETARKPAPEHQGSAWRMRVDSAREAAPKEWA